MTLSKLDNEKKYYFNHFSNIFFIEERYMEILFGMSHIS